MDEEQKEQANWLSNQIIGAAIEVHRQLGPGLLESAYQICHKHELGLRNIPVETEVPLPLRYKGVQLDCGYRMMKWLGDLLLLNLNRLSVSSQFIRRN